MGRLMEKPYLDMGNAAVRRMIKLIKRRGYVTSEELNEVMPSDEFTSEQIEEVINQLTDIGVKVIYSGKGS